MISPTLAILLAFAAAPATSAFDLESEATRIVVRYQPAVAKEIGFTMPAAMAARGKVDVELVGRRGEVLQRPGRLRG